MIWNNGKARGVNMPSLASGSVNLAWFDSCSQKKQVTPAGNRTKKTNNWGP